MEQKNAHQGPEENGKKVNELTEGPDVEAAIKSILKKIRRMNSRHPDLFRKLWEQEKTKYLTLETDNLESSMPSLKQRAGEDRNHRKRQPVSLVKIKDNEMTLRSPAQRHTSLAAILQEPISNTDSRKKDVTIEVIDLTGLSDNERRPTKRFKRSSVLRNDASAAGSTKINKPSTPFRHHSAHALQDKCDNFVVTKPIPAEKGLRRDTYNTTTIASDVLRAMGKHPGVPGLNQHLEILKTTLASCGAARSPIDGNFDLSTISWNALKPNECPTASLRPAYSFREHMSDEDGGNENQPPTRLRAAISVGDTGEGAAAHVNISRNPKLIKDGSISHVSLKNDRFRQRVGGSSVPSHQPGRSTIKTDLGTGRTLVALSAAPAGFAASSYSQLRASQTAPGMLDETQDRRSGWGQAESPTGKDYARVPRYPIYQCKWKNCNAKLHNLETLRKHVERLHGLPTDTTQFLCQWEGCGRSFEWRKSTFQSVEPGRWEKHMEQSHIGPLAWRLGDGPAGGFSDFDISDAYLSDSCGQQVTPWARFLPGLTALEDMSIGSAVQLMKTAARRDLRAVEIEAIIHRSKARTRNHDKEDVSDGDNMEVDKENEQQPY